MSQHDLDIANASGSAVRSDLNLALKALGSTSIGSSAPGTLQTGQIWIDNSGTPWVVKVYDGAQHITVGTVNASTNAFSLAVAEGGTGAATATAGFDALSPMTAEGDVVYGGSSGTVTRLAKGTDKEVLTLASGVPSWAAGPSIGLNTIFIPAAAMRPTASNGCEAIADAETTAGRPDVTGLGFDASSDEHAQFQIALPKMWALGTVTYQVFWASTAADTDGVSWALQGASVPDNSTIDLAYGTAVVIDDANQGAAEEQLVSAVSGAVTIAGTPADDDMSFFRIFRDVSDGNDTAGEDAILIGIKLFITTDAGNDA